jgi:hypothetical protein
LSDVDCQDVQDVVSFSLENRMRLDSDRNIQVARTASASSRFSLPGQPDLRAILNSGWNRNCQGAVPAFPAPSFASGAGIDNYLALSSACLTRNGLNKLAEHVLMGATQLSRAFAIFAGIRGAIGFALAASATGAHLDALDFDLLVRAEYRLLKVHGHGSLKMRSTPGSTSARPCACLFAATEKGVENVTKAAEDVESIEASSPAISTDGSVTKLVVLRPLLRIGEDLISLVDLLKSICSTIAPVSVWMILQSELSEGLLYLFIGGISANTENLVEVTFTGGHSHFQRRM